MKTQMLLLVLMVVVDIGAAPTDFTYSCWLNGWRKNANDRSADVFAIETSHYGFCVDVADFRKVGLARLNNQVSYEQALGRKAKSLSTLAAADLLIELEVDGVSYRAKTCKAGQRKDVKRLSSVRLWESGRYVQHYDFRELDIRNAQDQTLTCDARLDLVAWPESLTLSLNVSASLNCKAAVLRLGLASQAGNWSQDLKVEGSWISNQEKSVSMTCPLAPAAQIPSAEVTVTTQAGQDIAVQFDPGKNCYVAPVNRLRRNWNSGYGEIRDYDDFKITVKGSGAARPIPPTLILNRAHWHDWDFQRAVEACQGRTGYHGITDKCWKPGGTAAADEIQGHADVVLQELVELRKIKGDKTWQCTLGDIEAMAHLGLYYAEKIRAADTKNTESQEAIQHLKKAAGHLRRYATVAGKQYMSQLLSKAGRTDWQQGYENALKDIVLLVEILTVCRTIPFLNLWR